MKYTVKFTSKFKRDYKLAIKRGYPIKLLEETVSLIANGKTLPEKYMDHALSGNLTAIFRATGCWSIELRTMCLS
jgi:mRNA interferase YafQ